MSSNTETNPEQDLKTMNVLQIIPWISSQMNRKNFNVVLILTGFVIYYNKSEQRAAEQEKRDLKQTEELKAEFRDCNSRRDDCEGRNDELVDFIKQYIVDSKKNQ